MVSKRIKLFGSKPVVGDLVIVDNNMDTSQNVKDEELKIKEEEGTLETCDNSGDDINNGKYFKTIWL